MAGNPLVPVPVASRLPSVPPSLGLLDLVRDRSVRKHERGVRLRTRFAEVDSRYVTELVFVQMNDRLEVADAGMHLAGDNPVKQAIVADALATVSEAHRYIAWREVR